MPCSAYVAKNYPVLKKLNPSLPILIREAAGAEPRMIARYGSQRVECVHLFYSFEFVCLIASLPLPSSVLLGDRMLQTLARVWNTYLRTLPISDAAWGSPKPLQPSPPSPRVRKTAQRR